MHQIKLKDIEAAFKQAQKGRNACLSFFEHDRRFKTIENILNLMIMIKKISKKYNKIKWFYKNAVDAANLSLNIKNYKKPKFSVSLKKENRIEITVKGDMFNRAPFLCYKIKNKIQEIPLNVLGLNKWVTAPFEKSKNKQNEIISWWRSPCGVANVQHFGIKLEI